MAYVIRYQNQRILSSRGRKDRLFNVVLTEKVWYTIVITKNQFVKMEQVKLKSITVIS